MPCNDHQSFGDEGLGNNGIFDNNMLHGHGHDPLPSSSTNANISIEERRVSLSTESNASNIHTFGHSEHNNGGRSRVSSTRSINLHYFGLPGEELIISPDNENYVDMDSCRLFITRYRIIVISHNHNAMCAIPLTGVDLLEAKDVVGLQISCKDGKIIKLRAENSEVACTWYKKLIQKTCIVRDLYTLFAFIFYSETCKAPIAPYWLKEQKRHPTHTQLFQEFRRLKLSERSWKITDVNENFEVCQTYPKYLIVPSSVDNEDLKQMSFGRFYRRFPTLVWRNQRNGATLLRSSQPLIGFFGIANDKDITLYERIREAISSDSNSKFLIVDARSYTAAWANRAKGGGFEATDTYKNAEVLFMGLPNIHNIRYSFHQLRQLLNSGTDPTYLQTLQSTLWLQNIAQLFTATERCLNSLCSEGVSVLVHCSDGWDRTAQIVSLCMLIADPYYRTFDGFEMLIQRQWVEFGHKFADRGGVLNSDDNEKSPVFLQFLDCVYQLWMGNPDQFEFNRRYLMKLVQHTFSGLFGTFLFNSIKEAAKNGCDPDGPEQKCYQIWSYLGKHNTDFKNPAYSGKDSIKRTLHYPKTVPELILWRDAYCCTNEQSLINNPDNTFYPSNGISNTDISSEKTNNPLSRSQSVASLTSLYEQNGNSVQSTNHCYTQPNSTNTGGMGMGHLTTKLSENLSINSSNGQLKLDADGLSPCPLQVEDFFQKKISEMEKKLLQQQQQKGSQTIQIKDGSGSNKLNGNTETPRRKRNESVDSFEHVHAAVGIGNTDFRLKHNSSSSLTSGCQPSSFSSNCTNLSDLATNNNGNCSRNGVLQEGIENADMNEENGLEMSHASSILND